MRNEYDVANCEWCKGDGKDHGTLGMATVRDCPRCAGSGRVYVTSRESATGRRRVYKGPAPKPGVVASLQHQELTESLRMSPGPDQRRRDALGRFVTHGRHHAA